MADEIQERRYFRAKPVSGAALLKFARAVAGLAGDGEAVPPIDLFFQKLSPGESLPSPEEVAALSVEEAERVLDSTEFERVCFLAEYRMFWKQVEEGAEEVGPEDGTDPIHDLEPQSVALQPPAQVGETGRKLKNPAIVRFLLRTFGERIILKTVYDDGLDVPTRRRLSEAVLAGAVELLGLEPVETYALALSGGGFRATLYHLGVLRLLRDTGHLVDVSTTVAVSGGSILAAHLAANWDDYCSDPEATEDDAPVAPKEPERREDGERGEEESTEGEKGVEESADRFVAASRDIVKLVQYHLRERIIPKFLLRYVLWRVYDLWRGLTRRIFGRQSVRKMSPRQLKKFETRRRMAGTSEKSPTFWLSHYYEKILFDGEGRNLLRSLKPRATPRSLSEAPDTHLLATGLKEGSLCSFSSDGLTIEISSDASEDRKIESTTYPLSKAVAASSAFPGLFVPLRVTPGILGAKEDSRFREEFLSDGGVYDNIGIRKLIWMLEKREGLYTFDRVIISDAGAPFAVQYDTRYDSGYKGFLRLFMRAPDILMRRVSDLENRVALQELDDNRFRQQPPILSSIQTRSAKARRYLTVHPEYQTWLAEIRTDLSYFSDEEVSALVQHGYSVTRDQFLLKLPTGRQADFARRSLEAWNPLDDSEEDDDTKDAGRDPAFLSVIEAAACREARIRDGGHLHRALPLMTTTPSPPVVEHLMSGRSRPMGGRSMLGEWEGKALLFLGILLLGVLATWPYITFRNKALRAEVRSNLEEIRKNLKEFEREEGALLVDDCRRLESAADSLSKVLTVADLARAVVREGKSGPATVGSAQEEGDTGTPAVAEKLAMSPRAMKSIVEESRTLMEHYRDEFDSKWDSRLKGLVDVREEMTVTVRLAYISNEELGEKFEALFPEDGSADAVSRFAKSRIEKINARSSLQVEMTLSRLKSNPRYIFWRGFTDRFVPIDRETGASLFLDEPVNMYFYALQDRQTAKTTFSVIEDRPTDQESSLENGDGGELEGRNFMLYTVEMDFGTSSMDELQGDVSDPVLGFQVGTFVITDIPPNSLVGVAEE